MDCSVTAQSMAEDVDAVSGGIPEGGAKIRVGGVVGVQVFYVPPFE